jgi:glycoprotein 6-alpha-L-fucosyltransferase
MDMRPEIQNKIDQGMNRLGFKKPIVGVHVRRTDKLIREASYHSLEEYMRPVEKYYDKLELTEKVEKRRIFLATDEPEVIKEASRKYPHYEIIADYEATLRASNLTSRYSTTSLMGFLLDLHLLSLSDYIVCTLSSEVCRVAYELMQTYHLDASDRVYSNDFIYYYNGHPP